MEILFPILLILFVLFVIRQILKAGKAEEYEIISIKDKIDAPSFDHTLYEYTSVCGDIEVNYKSLPSFNSAFITLLKKYAQEGWELYKVETVWEHRKPGCLGTLLGWNIARVPHQVFIFRKKK